jgi:hypothetical protein
MLGIFRKSLTSHLSNIIWSHHGGLPQVVYNPAGESQTGYLVGTGTYHYTIKSETVCVCLAVDSWAEEDAGCFIWSVGRGTVFCSLQPISSDRFVNVVIYPRRSACPLWAKCAAESVSATTSSVSAWSGSLQFRFSGSPAHRRKSIPMSPGCAHLRRVVERALCAARKTQSASVSSPLCASLQLLGYLRHVHINVNGNTGMLTYLPWSTLPKLERSENPVTVAGTPYCLQDAKGSTLTRGAPLCS